MGKNVLVISSSPRKKSNSNLLCDRFIDGAIKVGNQAEKIQLKNCHIGYCIACESCLKNCGKCWQNDDMVWIMEKLHQADVIVLATPVYKSCMCAQLKTFIDRMFAGNSTLVNKDFYFIATAADSKAAIESTMESMSGCTFALKGAQIKGKIYGANVMNQGEVRNTKAMDEAYDYGLHI